MTIHEKLQKIKLDLLNCNLKKSGKNKFAGFDYYELSDILPDIIKLCEKYEVYTIVDFHSDHATLTAYDCEDLNSESLTVCSPVVSLEIRGANAIQALGGVQTYLRRYLYIAMFDITENDQFDAVSGKKEELKKYCCEICGADFKPFTDSQKSKWCSGKEAYEQVKKKYGKAVCKECREKPKITEEKMKKIDEKFITQTKAIERKKLHKGLDLVVDLIEVTSQEHLNETGCAIESYTDLLKKYCATLTALEELKNA